MEEWKPCFIRTDLLLVCLASPDQWNNKACVGWIGMVLLTEFIRPQSRDTHLALVHLIFFVVNYL